MPKTTNTNFIESKNAEECAPIFLYIIYDYDGAGNNFYVAEYETSVTFNSQAYTAFPITHNSIGENTVGEIDKINISLGNVSRYIQGYLETYDFRGLKVDIKTVFADHLADTDAVITETYYIDSYGSDQSDVVFNLTSKFDVLNVQVPIRKFTRNQCPWGYNSDECNVSSVDFVAYPACGRTLADCRLRNNSSRFGGFPSIPDRGVYFG